MSCSYVVLECVALLCFVALHFMLLCSVVLYCVALLCFVVMILCCCAVLYYVLCSCVVLYCAVLCFVVLFLFYYVLILCCNVMFWYAMFCFIIVLYYVAVLCYFVLCFVVLNPLKLKNDVLLTHWFRFPRRALVRCRRDWCAPRYLWALQGARVVCHLCQRLYPLLPGNLPREMTSRHDITLTPPWSDLILRRTVEAS